MRFENTPHLLRCILRTLGGGVLYFGLNEALKMPFSRELLNGGSVLAHLLRSARYAVVIFVLIGVYPMLFRLTDRLWDKKERKTQTKETG